MKKIIHNILAALFIMGSINVAIANDDNYHGNDIKGMMNTPSTTFAIDSHTFDDDEYEGND